MRVRYPKELHDEVMFIFQYMEYDVTLGWHLKANVPKDIVDRYEKLIKRMSEIEEEEEV